MWLKVLGSLRLTALLLGCLFYVLIFWGHSTPPTETKPFPAQPIAGVASSTSAILASAPAAPAQNSTVPEEPDINDGPVRYLAPLASEPVSLPATQLQTSPQVAAEVNLPVATNLSASANVSVSPDLSVAVCADAKLLDQPVLDSCLSL